MGKNTKTFKEYNEDINLSNARRHRDESKRYFGFRSECTGKETLGEFAKKHGMKI